MFFLRADYRGGGVVKVLILQFFFEIWKWFAHEATNHDCPEYYIFCRDVVSFQECFIFCLALWKRKRVYIQCFWCLQWILHYCCTYYHMYTHIYIYTHYLTNLSFFSQKFMFLEKYVFDIEHTWVQFPAANSAFSEKCSASFHAVHECFSKKNMSRLNMHFFKRWFNYDWIWTFSGHHLYFALKALPCWIKSSTLAGNQCTLHMKAQLKLEKCTSWKDCCILNIFFLRRSCILKTTLLSAVNCVLYLCENVKIQAHVWKIYCMLCTISAPFKGDNGL